MKARPSGASTGGDSAGPEGQRPSCLPGRLRRTRDSCPEPGRPALGPAPVPRAAGRRGAPRGTWSPVAPAAGRRGPPGNGATLPPAAALLLPPAPRPRPSPGRCPRSFGFLICELQITLPAARGRAKPRRCTRRAWSLPCQKRLESGEYHSSIPVSQSTCRKLSQNI